MNAIIKEVALYVFFVACLCIVSYSHRDPTSFAFRKTMYDTFVEVLMAERNHSQQ